jgi:hypothetical protein
MVHGWYHHHHQAAETQRAKLEWDMELGIHQLPGLADSDDVTGNCTDTNLEDRRRYAHILWQSGLSFSHSSTIRDNASCNRQTVSLSFRLATCKSERLKKKRRMATK